MEHISIFDMKIAMIGTGYVGLVTGTCLASLGNNVICVDNNKEKIDKLNNGEMPIFEPGLKEMVELNVKEDLLYFTSDIKKAIIESEVIFIAVGTPPDENGKADLQYVFSVAKDIGEHMNEYKVIVDKSTVPVGTADKIKEVINSEEVDVVSNPEFLREGQAIKDFMNPDRVVIGCETDKAKEIMAKIYRGIERTGKPVVYTDIKSAELIKYASNCMLATRISFMNMLAPLCEEVGANIKAVSRGMGLDNRIGPRFLHAGLGYGGSCFPKDVRALIETMKEKGLDNSILTAVDNINKNQKTTIIPKIKKLVGDLKGKTIAIWGLSYKPKTDDMRDAPSIGIISELQKLGAKIKAFDPVANGKAKDVLTNVEYGKNPYDTVEGCEAVVIVTEWDVFRQLDLEKVKTLLNSPNIIDGRNIYDPAEMKDFNYISIGR